MLRMHIETLGPLRDTKIEFGDVTFLIGLPNAGKSYILRALYSHLLLFDPPVVLDCIMPSSPSRSLATLVEEIEKLLEVHIDPSKVMLQEERGLITAVVKDVHVCINPNLLIELVYRILPDCIYTALLPRGVRTSLEDKTRIENAKERLAKIIEHVFIETLQRKIIQHAYVKPEFYHRDRLICAELPLVKYRVREKFALLREELLESTEQGQSLESTQYDEYERSKVVNEIQNHFRWSLSPARMLYNALNKLTAVEETGRVVYAAYGRSLISQVLFYVLLRPEEYVYPDLADVFEVRSLPALSLYRALTEGLRLIDENQELKRILEDIFQPLLRGKIELRTGELIYYANGAQVPLHLASALAGEAAALMLASAPAVARGRGWLLVEEPEAQLHPSAQVLVPAVLYALAAHGVRLVVTTHSPIVAGVAATLASLAQENSVKLRRALISLIDRFSSGDGKLAEVVAEALPRLDVRFYHVDNGKVLAKTAEEIELEIPTLSEVPVDLAKWSLSLT